jgi:hypothetical protein
MKFALVATVFAALASTGFAESPSIRANDAPGAATTTIGAASTGGGAPADVVGVITADKKKHQRRGLGNKANGKDPDGYMYKHCCNDDWYCGGETKESKSTITRRHHTRTQCRRGAP